MDNHYSRQPKRKAEFIRPPNDLKQKVGNGGLDEAVLEKAQKLIETASVDFLPMGKRYLTALEEGLSLSHSRAHELDSETLISTMLYPAMQLKANGGMFGYQLVTSVASRLVQFLEVLDTPNEDALEVVNGFATVLRSIIMGQIEGNGGDHGPELYEALDEACERFLDKYNYPRRAASASAAAT